MNIKTTIEIDVDGTKLVLTSDKAQELLTALQSELGTQQTVINPIQWSPNTSLIIRPGEVTCVTPVRPENSAIHQLRK